MRTAGGWLEQGGLEAHGPRVPRRAPEDKGRGAGSAERGGGWRDGGMGREVRSMGTPLIQALIDKS